MHVCLAYSCPRKYSFYILTINLMDFSLSGKYTGKDVILKNELGKEKIK